MEHEVVSGQLELGLLIGIACIMLAPMVFGGITAIYSLKVLEKNDNRLN